jgi:hypothetical protein
MTARAGPPRAWWFVDAAAGAGARSCGSTSLARPKLGLGREHLLPMQARKGPRSATVALLARSASLAISTERHAISECRCATLADAGLVSVPGA